MPVDDVAHDALDPFLLGGANMAEEGCVIFVSERGEFGEQRPSLFSRSFAQIVVRLALHLDDVLK